MSLVTIAVPPLPPPAGASTNSIAFSLELTAKYLLAVSDEGVSVSPKKVVGLEST